MAVDELDTGPEVEQVEESEGNHIPPWGIVAVAAAVVVLGVVALALIRANEQRPPSGVEAPDFTLQLLDSEETITLSDLRGQVVLLNFWASWCEPCKDEAPELEAFWQAYRDKGVVFIGIDWLDPENLAREYLEEFGLTFPNGRDLEQRIGNKYRITGVPETFLIDQNGIIDKVYLGPINFADLRIRLDNLLGS